MSIKFGDFSASDELFTHRLRLRPAEPVDEEDQQGFRFAGTLKHWNADRHFGFITRDEEAGDIFVHGKAFDLAGIDPAVGLRLAFTIAREKDGRLRVDHVRREAGPAAR